MAPRPIVTGDAAVLRGRAPIALTVVVNPVLERLDDERFEVDEGCLSLPGVRGVVTRAVNVRVRYGVLFTDRVEDPASLMTWDEFEREHRAAFEARARARVARIGS